MKDKVAISKNKYTGHSAQKVRLVADMVRGMNAQDAINMLYFVNKAASLHVSKAIKSALSNAVNNHEMDKKKLVISKILVDEAPTLKRYRIASRRGPQQVLKRSSHILVELKEQL